MTRSKRTLAAVIGLVAMTGLIAGCIDDEQDDQQTDEDVFDGDQQQQDDTQDDQLIDDENQDDVFVDDENQQNGQNDSVFDDEQGS